MPWMIQEDKLDSQQREYINKESIKEGNIWIQGFAGSGKSVLLVHQIRDLLRQDRESNAKICVVVFTHALAELFRAGMSELKLPRIIPVANKRRRDYANSRSARKHHCNGVFAPNDGYTQR